MLPVPAPLPAPGAMGAPARRPWLFPLVLLAIAIGAIVALTLAGVPVPIDLQRMGIEPLTSVWLKGNPEISLEDLKQMGIPPPVPGAIPWDELFRNLGHACAWGLCALPVIAMTGLLAAGGFDWGIIAALSWGAAFIVLPGDLSPLFKNLVRILAISLGFGATGWLFAGCLGWSVNRAALLNLLLGMGIFFVVGLFIDANLGFLLSTNQEEAELTAAMLLVVAWLLRRSALGRRLRAIGEDGDAARLVGAARGWPLFLAFTLSALGMVTVAPNFLLVDSSPALVVISSTFNWFEAFGISATEVYRDSFIGQLRWTCCLSSAILPFLAIAACGGGLMGRGRVCLSGIVCAGLAVPMLLCALEWLWPENLWHLPLLAALALVGWRVQRAPRA